MRIHPTSAVAIGIASGQTAVALGIAAAYALVRFPGFRGINLFVGLVTAPLIMPEVVTGLALLLVFVALQESTGWPTQRGLLTITLAHSTFTMAYVTVVMQARLMSFDRAPEEAIARTRIELGLDRPLPVQFLRYVERLAHGDLGNSA